MSKRTTVSDRAGIAATVYLFGEDMTTWRWPQGSKLPNPYRAAYDAFQEGFKAGRRSAIRAAKRSK